MEFLFSGSITLIVTTIIMAVIGLLGLAVFNSDQKSATNRAFLALSLVTICYAIANYWGIGEHGDTRPLFTLYALRATVFFATLHSFLIFHLFYIFPRKDYTLPPWYRYILIPEVILVALLTLSPYIFRAIKTFSQSGIATEIDDGPLIPLFGITVFGLIVTSFLFGIQKLRRAKDMERKQLSYLLAGATITYSLLLIFNFILPIVFNNSGFVRHAPLFLTPFIGLTGYAIYKHQLFNIKVLATQAFVLIIAVVYFAKILIATTATDRLIDGLIFLATASFGLLLIRSVKQEVQAREEIAALAEQLSNTNSKLQESNEQLRIIDQRKSEFVSIVSHQLRTPITALRGYASMILEDSYGKLSDEMRPPVEKIFRSASRLAQMVTEFLDISKIEQGTMTYVLTPVDIGAMITDLGDDFAQVAQKKGLEFSVHIPKGTQFIATADDGKIRQIFSNLIDNSIKYTPKGSVAVSVARDEKRGMIVINLKDTGIGLSQDDIHHLFGKFTRGSGGQKQNTEGSGLGLYVAKSMLEAQKGNIWVDSEGPGKGSTFFIELRAE